MARENKYYREILAVLLERFGGKPVINASEYAEYLGISVGTTCKYIRSGLLPGKALGRGRQTFVIPLTSVAMYECTQKN